MPSQCLCRQRQKEIELKREGDVITEVENAVMQPEAKESLSHQELEEVRNKATPEPPDQTPPTCCCSVTQLYPTLCNPMDCSMPGSPVLQHLPEFAQIHVHSVGNVIQPSRPLSSPSPAFNLSQHQGLCQWISSLHQVAKVLELQHQCFQWVFRVDYLSDWLVWSPCSPRDSQESSPASQLESINSLVLSLPYGPALTPIDDYWKNHTFDYIDCYWQIDVSVF